MYLDKQTKKEPNTYQTNEMEGGRYMARNKYPEITVEKILEVSQRLFMEKGYDNTTIQDIVNELGGLTKGAIYHHFKSKEEIIDALGGKLFFDNNPFVTVQNQKKLNGLEKMREVIKLNHADNDRTELGKQSIPLLKNPRLLAELADTNRKLIALFGCSLFKRE